MNDCKTVVKCPNCGNFWSGETLSDNCISTNFGVIDNNKCVNCLVCGAYYKPIDNSIVMYDFVADNFMSVKGG